MLPTCPAPRDVDTESQRPGPAAGEQTGAQRAGALGRRAGLRQRHGAASRSPSSPGKWGDHLAPRAGSTAVANILRERRARARLRVGQSPPLSKELPSGRSQRAALPACDPSGTDSPGCSKGGSLVNLVLQMRRTRHGDGRGLGPGVPQVSGKAGARTRADRGLEPPLALLPRRGWVALSSLRPAPHSPLLQALEGTGRSKYPRRGGRRGTRREGAGRSRERRNDGAGLSGVS